MTSLLALGFLASLALAAESAAPPTDSLPQAWTVDAARTDALRWRLPAVGASRAWIASGRQTIDRMGLELATRSLLEVEVAAGPGGGRSWSAVSTPLEVSGWSDFGPIEPEALAPMRVVQRSSWRTASDGAIAGASLDEGIAEAVQSAVGGLASSLQLPGPPSAVSPGATWTREATVEIPVESPEAFGRLSIATTTDMRFVGWVVDGGHAYALLEVATVIELQGGLVADGMGVQVGGVGRSGSQVLYDPETGFARWQALRNRITVTAGDTRPEVVEQVMVLGLAE